MSGLLVLEKNFREILILCQFLDAALFFQIMVFIVYVREIGKVN